MSSYACNTNYHLFYMNRPNKVKPFEESFSHELMFSSISNDGGRRNSYTDFVSDFIINLCDWFCLESLLLFTLNHHDQYAAAAVLAAAAAAIAATAAAAAAAGGTAWS